MFFTKIQRYQSSIAKEDLKSRLAGNHFMVHDMDFEIFEKGQTLRIVPHAEQAESIKTLPITRIEMSDEGGVVVTSKMRKLDIGGPVLLMLFSSFLIIASLILMGVDGEPKMTYSLLGAGIGILLVFFVRMQMGYFDYVRKISNYIKNQLEAGSQFAV